MLNGGLFRKSGYHLFMAGIYILTGLLLLGKTLLGDKDVQLILIGSIISVYGIYRFASGLRKKAVSDEK